MLIDFIFNKAVLKQNISWFDSEGAGEVATRISSDTLYIQDGISDKLPLFLSQVCTTLAGFAIALWKSWYKKPQVTLYIYIGNSRW